MNASADSGAHRGDSSDAAGQQEQYEVFLLALLLWREARGEDVTTKRCVAWSVRNRVEHPSWWGVDWASVIAKKFQYSSMTAPGDPNLTRWPLPADTSWIACMHIASQVYRSAIPDPSRGATHYYDKSLDRTPPAWAAGGGMIHVLDSGNFHFFKPAAFGKHARLR